MKNDLNRELFKFIQIKKMKKNDLNEKWKMI